MDSRLPLGVQNVGWIVGSKVPTAVRRSVIIMMVIQNPFHTCNARLFIDHNLNLR